MTPAEPKSVQIASLGVAQQVGNYDSLVFSVSQVTNSEDSKSVPVFKFMCQATRSRQENNFRQSNFHEAVSRESKILPITILPRRLNSF
jgi:hypothetical protein